MVADEIESNFIRVFFPLIQRELCSMNPSDSNDSIMKNPLDTKYLTEFERNEIKKYKDVYYIGHKAHLRKVRERSGSIKTTSRTDKITTKHWLEIISAIAVRC